MLYLLISHFLVDFQCICLLNSVINVEINNFETVILFALIYNGIAFAFQLPIGSLADFIGKNNMLTATGILFVVLGTFITNPILLCITIGIGNAMFHIGGGREALLIGEGKAFSIGQFVSTGAMGVFLAGKFYNISYITYIVCVLLIVSAILIFLHKNSNNEIKSSNITNKGFIKIAIYMFSTVLLRAYMGTMVHYSFQNTFIFSLLFVAAIVLGKFFGGILSDKFGMAEFSIVSQVLCVLCFLLSFKFSLFAFIAIFLWNTTMAITATVLSCSRPKYCGTLFGLTTLALFLGTSVNQANLLNFEMNIINVTVISIVSALLFIRGILIFKGDSER